MLTPLRPLAAVLAAGFALLACASANESRLLRKYQDAFDRGRFSEAVIQARTLLARAERSSVPSTRITALERTAQAEEAAGDWTASCLLHARALALADDTRPIDSGLLSEVLTGSAICRRQKREYEAAAQLLQRAVALAEPLGDIRLGSALRALALVESEQNRAASAEALLERSIAADKASAGPGARDLALSYNNLANLQMEQGRYAEAATGFDRARAIALQHYGPDHPDVAFYQGNLGLVYMYQGRYEEAEQLDEQAVTGLQHAYGPNDEQVLFKRFNLATVRKARGKLRQVEHDYEELLPLFEQVLGPGREETRALLGNFCGLEFELGSYAYGEELCRRASAGWDEPHGPTPPGALEASYVGGALNTLGASLTPLGRFEEAERALLRAREVQASIGPRYHEVGSAIQNLAELYRLQGNRESAARLLDDATSIFEDALGKSHPKVAAPLLTRANLTRDRGKALKLYRRALDILRSAYGPGHARYGEALSDIATGCGDPCALGDRLQLAERALAIARDALGADHLETAGALSTLGNVRAERGDHHGAVSAFRDAVGAYERAGGHLSISTKRALRSLAWEEARAGTLRDALRDFTRLEQLEEQQLQNFLGWVTEARQRAFLDDVRSSLDHLVAFQQRWLPNSPDAARLVLQAVLRRKARALDVTSAQLKAAQLGTGEVAKSLRQLRGVRSDLAALLLRGSGGLAPDLYAARISELGAERERLESVLAAQTSPEQNSAVTVDAVGAALPRGAALLEFVRYTPPLRGARARYALYALKDRGHAISALDLGDADQLERHITNLRAALAVPGGDVATPARALDARVIEPLESFLADVECTYVVPDGAFHLVPFAALVDAKRRFRVERFEWSTLDSGRDLLRSARNDKLSEVTLRPALVLGGAAFDLGPVDDRTPPQTAAQADLSRSRGLRSRDLDTRKFAPLPATETEARAVARELGVAALLGGAASETRIKAAESPIVLHVATHAYFLKDLAAPARSRDVAEPVLREQENQMLRSGLALAGANLRDARAAGLSGEDGILTALEAATLSLTGTELVTLSACDTGVGAIDRGEGVLGLRRAFALAGARSLLVSLWSVNDTATGRFMVEYYRRLARREGRAAALRAVQRSFLANPVLSDPYYWAPFQIGGERGPIAGLTSPRASNAQGARLDAAPQNGE